MLAYLGILGLLFSLILLKSKYGISAMKRRVVKEAFYKRANIC
jgi:hypothetical protein